MPHKRKPKEKKETNSSFQIIMTPVIFVSFLASLAWVEFRYSLLCSHSHSEAPSSLPGWLHRVVYQEAPYHYVMRVVDGGGSSSRPSTPRTVSSSSRYEEVGSRWYYHSKQRKLMKMEVDDAFEIRGPVLMALGLSALVLTWAVWRAGWWAWTAATVRFG